jgi:SNF2 family DNA or RNA helicase
VAIGGFIEDREDLLVDELKDVMIRRTRDMVRNDLPPKGYPSNVADDSGLTPGIYLPMTKKQRAAYEQMEKSGTASLDGGDVNAIGVLAELTRLKQFAGAEGALVGGAFQPIAAGNKYDWIVEFLRELGFPDRPATKIVIASQFTQLLNAFRDGVAKEFRLKPERYGVVTGEETGPRRLATVNRFEDTDSDLDLLWINTKAGGSAITLDAAEIMVVLDETWVSDEQEQLEGRIDNRQPERRIVPRSYYYLRSEGSLEENIAAANAEAKARGERILNGAAIAKRAKELTHR